MRRLAPHWGRAVQNGPRWTVEGRRPVVQIADSAEALYRLTNLPRSINRCVKPSSRFPDHPFPRVSFSSSDSSPLNPLCGSGRTRRTAAKLEFILHLDAVWESLNWRQRLSDPFGRSVTLQSFISSYSVLSFIMIASIGRQMTDNSVESVRVRATKAKGRRSGIAAPGMCDRKFLTIHDPSRSIPPHPKSSLLCMSLRLCHFSALLCAAAL
jgi:hypothetical protein